MKNRTFCDANHEIREKLTSIFDLIERGIKYENIESELDDIQFELSCIADIVEETQDYVESMENRMKLYKETIESLGFSRNRD